MMSQPNIEDIYEGNNFVVSVQDGKRIFVSAKDDDPLIAIEVTAGEITVETVDGKMVVLDKKTLKVT